MLYKNSKEWLDALKNHSCENKNFIPADDPSNDIWLAKVENREPLKHPRMGYVCQCCEEMFEINLSSACMDILPDQQKEIVSSLLNCKEGRKKLGEFLSGK
jgi:hypothetical protein